MSDRNVAPVLVVAAVALVGCATVTDEAQTPAGNMIKMMTDVVSPGARQQHQARVDDAKCREFGFKPQTENYGKCRLELERIRGGRGAAVSTATSPAAMSTAPSPGLDANRKVYDVSECVGPVVMGECHGSILPNRAYHPTCYGTMLNGQCTGPMF